MADNNQDKDKDLGQGSGARVAYRDTDLTVGVSKDECVCTMKRSLGELGPNQVDVSCLHHGDPRRRAAGVGVDEENDLPADPQAE